MYVTYFFTRLIQEISTFAESEAPVNTAESVITVKADKSTDFKTEADVFPIFFVMSYAAPTVRIGVKQFVWCLAERGAAGCIIPDLSVGCDEGLYQEAVQQGIRTVLVIAPNISRNQL